MAYLLKPVNGLLSPPFVCIHCIVQIVLRVQSSAEILPGELPKPLVS
jgi:hypothetical protein